PNREGLEDRVYRIKTERAGASTPEPRTTHIISNVELLGESDEGLELRYSWVTWSHRYQHTDAFFGATCCTLTEQDGRPQIVRKTGRLNNDYIRQVIDVYHI
ncbi:aromatic-ring-hydroxylating dioxygenase subunit beta, partial [Klebsiella quasipneumoniae]|uniref:aromatic-ring-hydroxylating dioxygenase subunit beta n=1 Tax=Klebsiella quasipneumoniae TaxID=1463165 RepID=UPI0023F10966